MTRSSACRILRAATLCGLILFPAAAGADPVKVRFPEGPSHGFAVVTDTGGKTIANAEVTQWLEDDVIASRLLIRFSDGSLYDEVVRFTQKSVFRLEKYTLTQRGPSFSETSEVEFDRAGKYRVRLRPAPDKDEETAAGQIEDMPADLTNGMTSIVLKNLMSEGSGQTRMLAFTPKPVVLDLHLTPQGTDSYALGRITGKATHYLMRPEVPGFRGMIADLLGKQPPTFSMWIAQGVAPTLIEYEGPLYAEGPTWRINITGPRLGAAVKKRARPTP